MQPTESLVVEPQAPNSSCDRDESSVYDVSPVDWQTAMKRAIRSPSRLRELLGLAPPSRADLDAQFATFVPLELLARVRYGCAEDPILRQVLAVEAESDQVPGFVSDPVGDLGFDVGGGALKKYHGRVLIVTHGACAVHCRYCFRREFPYQANASLKASWEPAMDSIAEDKSVEEVLLSGGDPLTLADSVLDRLIGQVESISHVKRLRIHTRLPIAIPQRVTEGFVERLSSSRLMVWVVIHSNHAQEIDSKVAESIYLLRRGGIPVLNQAVLLRGVNDDADVLAELSTALVNHGVQPYYLHQLDRVRGASHFWVDVERGKKIVEELRNRLPGYAVPKYVVEQVGEKSKTQIA